jgi:hypothetical protein
LPVAFRLLSELMKKNRHPPEFSLDQLFDPEGLRTEEQIELAILNFEHRLSKSNAERDAKVLLSKPNLFGFVFSGKCKHEPLQSC